MDSERERDADYLPRLGDWALGSALCAMVGVLVWFLVRRRGADVVAPSVPREIANEQLALLWLCAGAAALYGAVALLVFSGRPLLIDEVITSCRHRTSRPGGSHTRSRDRSRSSR